MSVSFVLGLTQSTSLVPSPLKSPVPATPYPAGCCPRSLLPAHLPFESIHTSAPFVLELNHSRSLVPSWLKSPTPATWEPSGCEPGSTLAAHLPFNSCHSSRWT